MVLKDICRLSKNSLAFSLGMLSTQAISFILLPIYTRYLSAADFGIISIAAVISAIFSIIYFFGMRGAIARFYYDYVDNPNELRQYLSTICITVMSISFCLTIILYLFGEPFFALFIPDVPLYPYLSLALWTTFFGIPLNFSLVLLQVREKPFNYSIINLSNFILKILLTLIFVIFYLEGALGSLKGQLIAGFVFFLIGIGILWKDISLIFNPKMLRDSLHFGLPMVLHELASWLNSMIDRIFLSYYTSLTIVGIYTVGYQVGAILALITMAINYAWVPYFYSTVKQYGEDARPRFATLTNYYIIFILFISLNIIFFSNNILNVIATPEYFIAVDVIPFVVLGYVFRGMYFMTVTQLFYLKKTAYISSSTIIAALVNVALNIILIPRYGMVGAGLATAVSYGFIFIIIYYISNKLFKINYDNYKITKIFVITFIIYGLYLFIPEIGELYEFALKVFLIITYLISLLLLDIIMRADVRDAIRKIYEYAFLRNEAIKPPI